MIEYLDTRFCENCDRDTEHLFRDSWHERDSSYDYQKCSVCEWYYYGLTGEYSPPEEINDKS